MKYSEILEILYGEDFDKIRIVISSAIDVNSFTYLNEDEKETSIIHTGVRFDSKRDNEDYPCDEPEEILYNLKTE